MVRDLIQFRHGIDRRLLHLDQPIGLTKQNGVNLENGELVLMEIDNSDSPVHPGTCISHTRSGELTRGECPRPPGDMHETSLDLDLRLDFRGTLLGVFKIFVLRTVVISTVLRNLKKSSRNFRLMVSNRDRPATILYMRNELVLLRYHMECFQRPWNTDT